MAIIFELLESLPKPSPRELDRLWRGTHIVTGMDLRDADLSYLNDQDIQFIFQHCSFRCRVFKGVRWRKCHFQACDFSGAEFDNTCHLAHTAFQSHSRENQAIGTVLDDVTFECEMAQVVFAGTRLNRTSFEAATVTGSPLDFSNCQGSVTRFGVMQTGCIFRDTHFVDAEFAGDYIKSLTTPGRDALFERCNFDGVSFEGCFFQGSKLLQCSLRNAKLGLEFQDADVRGSDFREADWTNAVLSNTTVDGAKLWPCTGLTGRYQARLDQVQGAERADYARNRLDSLCSWSNIRKVGSISLFGVSYFAILAICVWAGALHWSNSELTRLKGNVAFVNAAPWVAWIEEVPYGDRLGRTLVAILFLAGGATIYRFACPSEVQENSETAWTFSLRYERMRYLALATTRPLLRQVSWILYVVGGGYVVGELGWRVLQSFVYLWLRVWL